MIDRCLLKLLNHSQSYICPFTPPPSRYLVEERIPCQRPAENVGLQVRQSDIHMADIGLKGPKGQGGGWKYHIKYKG